MKKYIEQNRKGVWRFLYIRTRQQPFLIKTIKTAVVIAAAALTGAVKFIFISHIFYII